MASFSIHLAIGKKYIEKNEGIIQNTYEFYKGIIAPDLVDDKTLTHYTISVSQSNLSECVKNKVHLEKFLENETVDTDYQKGVFLHLVTDYLFFNDFFDKEYINSSTYHDFCQALYYSYNSINDYINTKYDLDYSDFLEAINENIQKNNEKRHLTYESGTNIISVTEIDKFIDNVSSINLLEYRDKIKEAHQNVLPLKNN